MRTSFEFWFRDLFSPVRSSNLFNRKTPIKLAREKTPPSWLEKIINETEVTLNNYVAGKNANPHKSPNRKLNSTTKFRKTTLPNLSEKRNDIDVEKPQRDDVTPETEPVRTNEPRKLQNPVVPLPPVDKRHKEPEQVCHLELPIVTHTKGTVFMDDVLETDKNVDPFV